MPEEEGGGSLLHVSISAEPLFTIGPLTVTNSMVGAASIQRRRSASVA